MLKKEMLHLNLGSADAQDMFRCNWRLTFAGVAFSKGCHINSDNCILQSFWTCCSFLRSVRFYYRCLFLL